MCLLIKFSLIYLLNEIVSSPVQGAIVNTDVIDVGIGVALDMCVTDFQILR